MIANGRFSPFEGADLRPDSNYDLLGHEHSHLQTKQAHAGSVHSLQCEVHTEVLSQL